MFVDKKHFMKIFSLYVLLRLLIVFLGLLIVVLMIKNETKRQFLHFKIK